MGDNAPSAAERAFQRKIAGIERRIAALVALREYALRERGREIGFRPCGDCHAGFCTMNCSGVPMIMKVMP